MTFPDTPMQRQQVAYDKQPRQDEKKHSRFSNFCAMIFPVVGAIFFVGAALSAAYRKQWLPGIPIGSALFAAGMLWTIIWGYYSFTGEPCKRRPQAVGFAYFFAFASLAVFMIPVVAGGRAFGGEPIGIVSGCVQGDFNVAEQVRCYQRVRPRPPVPAPAVPGTAAAAGRNSPPASRETLEVPKVIRNQWLVNIGGTLKQEADTAPDGCDDSSSQKDSICDLGSSIRPALIYGGVVVPLPFVVLALAGGAVSLSRRVPEIQRWIEDEYPRADGSPRLSEAEVRERLMFQIVQFVSAPLVAIVGYQVIQPESDATSAALAFMCGFGSEVILLRLRAAFETGMPEATPVENRAATGTIWGIVKQGERRVPDVEVRVNGSGISATSDDDGLFFIANLQAGQHQLLVQDGSQARQVSVSVAAGEAAKCTVDLNDARAPPRSGQRQ